MFLDAGVRHPPPSRGGGDAAAADERARAECGTRSVGEVFELLSAIWQRTAPPSEARVKSAAWRSPDSLHFFPPLKIFGSFLGRGKTPTKGTRLEIRLEVDDEYGDVVHHRRELLPPAVPRCEKSPIGSFSKQEKWKIFFTHSEKV